MKLQRDNFPGSAGVSPAVCRVLAANISAFGKISSSLSNLFRLKGEIHRSWGQRPRNNCIANCRALKGQAKRNKFFGLPFQGEIYQGWMTGGAAPGYNGAGRWPCKILAEKSSRKNHFHPAILHLLFSILVLATGCRRDMFNQPKSNPLKQSQFFENGAASRPIPPHTVSRGNLENDSAFYTGMNGTNLVTDFPIQITRQVLERGRQRYDIYCSPCHGKTGDGNGIVVARGFPAPPSYHIARLRNAPVGHFFDVMTRGYGAMYSYASRVSPKDRWAIAAYIRALQLSENATLADVPTNEIAKLKSSP